MYWSQQYVGPATTMAFLTAIYAECVDVFRLNWLETHRPAGYHLRIKFPSPSFAHLTRPGVFSPWKSTLIFT